MEAFATPDRARKDSPTTLGWIDRWLDTLFQRMDAVVIQQAAGEVARECHWEVWAYVSTRTGGMNAAQVRGYVRAIAPGFVLRDLDAVLSRRRLSRQLRQPVAAEAIEQMIRLIGDDLRCTRQRLRLFIPAKAA